MVDDDAPVAKLGKTQARLVFLAAVWLFTASIVQHGWLGGFLRPVLVFVGVAFAFGVFRGMRDEKAGSSLGFGLMLALGAWFYLAGSFGSWRLFVWDLGSVVLGIVAAGLLLAPATWLFKLDLNRLGGTRGQSAFMLGIFLTVWSTLSVVHVLRSRPLPVRPERLAELAASRSSIVPEHAELWRGRRVALALSGGGYRAALFHAGVLTALEDLGVPVTHLSTVSGGSIIGSYYAVGGDPVAFKDAVARGRFNLKRELLLVHNSARLILPLRLPVLDTPLLPWSYDRRDVQAALVRRLLLDGGEARLDVNQHQPRLLLNATDLTFGLSIGMTESGFLIRGPSDHSFYEDGVRLELSRPIDLADRVSISGAFPIAFPPFTMSVTVDPLHASGSGSRPLTLADGGIADNLGIGNLRATRAWARRKDLEPPPEAGTTPDASWSVDALLVSDASAAFEVDAELSQVEVFSRLFDVSSALGTPPRCAPARGTVSFSARLWLATPELLFKVFESATDLDDPARLGPRSRRAHHLPAAVLAALVDAASSERQTDLRAAADDFLAVSPYHGVPGEQALDGHLQPPRRRPSPPPADAPPEPPPRPPRAEWEVLENLIRAELGDSLGVFRRSSTLTDSFSPADAEALFRLGRYLVYLEWPRLSDALLKPGVEAPISE